MMKSHVRRNVLPLLTLKPVILAAAVLALLVPASNRVWGQNSVGEGDDGACTLRNHVYTCNAADLQKALSSANTVSFAIHNVDGIARKELKQLTEDKLHKTIVPDGSPADLVFLLEPIDQGGQVFESSALRDLGTLRVYSTTADGRPAHLLWAETYASDPTGHDLPWPVVAHGIVTRFEKRFQIK